MRISAARKMAPMTLVRAARAAATAQALAFQAHDKWVKAFKKEYGHDDISDPLVEAIDYCRGDKSALTREFIAANSEPGKS